MNKTLLFLVFLFVLGPFQSAVYGCLQDVRKKLAEDFKTAAANPSSQQAVFRNAYNSADDATKRILMDGYSKFYKRPQYRVDIPTITRMGEIVGNPQTMSKLAETVGSPQEAQKALDDIIENMKNKCQSCTSGGDNLSGLTSSEIFLENLKFAIDNHHLAENFDKVIGTLRSFGTLEMQDGMSHFLAVLRKFEGPSSGPPANGRSVTGFEGNIAEFVNDADNLSGVCTGCMFDLKLGDGTLLEAKSYVQQTLSGMKNSTNFKKQFRTYFQSANGKFEYWFNGLKVDDIDDIKDGFREIFRQDGFYGSVEGPSNTYLLSKGIFNKNDFLAAIDNLPILFDFVKKI